MKRTSSLTTLLTTGMALVFLATAAGAATTSGVVVSTDPGSNAITIQIEDGRRFSFQKSDATTFEQNGAQSRFADLAPGSRITVTSDETPSDPKISLPATHVQIDQRVGDAPVAVASNMDGDRSAADRLPDTATPLPLVTLAALGSIVAGLGLRLRRK